MREAKNGRLRWHKEVFAVFGRKECKYVLMNGGIVLATASNPSRSGGWTWFAGGPGVPYGRYDASQTLDLDEAKAAAMAYVKQCLAARPSLPSPAAPDGDAQ